MNTYRNFKGLQKYYNLRAQIRKKIDVESLDFFRIKSFTGFFLF